LKRLFYVQYTFLANVRFNVLKTSKKCSEKNVQNKPKRNVYSKYFKKTLKKNV